MNHLYDLLHATVHGHGPRRPLTAPRCTCTNGPLVDHNDEKHNVVTCIRCGRRPADRILARQGRKAA